MYIRQPLFCASDIWSSAFCVRPSWAWTDGVQVLCIWIGLCISI